MTKIEPWLYGNIFESGRYKQAGTNKINKLGEWQEMSVPKCQDVERLSILTSQVYLFIYTSQIWIWLVEKITMVPNPEN